MKHTNTDRLIRFLLPTSTRASLSPRSAAKLVLLSEILRYYSNSRLEYHVKVWQSEQMYSNCMRN